MFPSFIHLLAKLYQNQQTESFTCPYLNFPAYSRREHTWSMLFKAVTQLQEPASLQMQGDRHKEWESFTIAK